MSANQARHLGTLHYRHDGIVVTSRYFATSTARLAVGELSHLAQSQGVSRPGARTGLVAAAWSFAVAVPMLTSQHSTNMLVTALPLIMVACVVSYVCTYHWPIQRELVARYRGRDITLFTTTDEQQFGKVARALLRAVENARFNEGGLGWGEDDA